MMQVFSFLCSLCYQQNLVVTFSFQILVFGSNAKGQLGLPKVDFAAAPTVAFKIKTPDDKFVRCAACDAYSAAFTEQVCSSDLYFFCFFLHFGRFLKLDQLQGRCYIAGSNFPWQNETVAAFAYAPTLHHRKAFVTDIGLVTGAWGSSSKVGYFLVTHHN